MQSRIGYDSSIAENSINENSQLAFSELT